MTSSDDEATTGWTRFWDRGAWWKAILIVAAYLVIYELAGLLVSGPFAGAIDPQNVFATPQSVFVALTIGLLIGAVVLIAFTASVRWFAPIFARQPLPGRWWMWIFAAIAIIPIVLRLIGIDYGRYAPGVLAVTLSTGLLIGFTEELLYRGIVVRILRSAGHRELVVAVISSALFALSHAVNALTGQAIATVGITLLYTFGFGILMYLVMRVTGNIVWAMLVHGFTDPTTMLAVGGVDTSTTSGGNVWLEIAAPFNLVIIAAGLIALFFIRGRALSPQTVTGSAP